MDEETKALLTQVVNAAQDVLGLYVEDYLDPHAYEPDEAVFDLYQALPKLIERAGLDIQPLKIEYLD